MSLVQIDNINFKHSMSLPELKNAMAAIQLARAERRVLLKSLQEAIKAGDLPHIGEATALIFSSHQFRLAAAVEANGKIKQQKRQSLERCLALPEMLKFDAPLAEIVRAYAKKKPNGDIRPICDFKLAYRTAQTMVEGVGGRYLKPRAFQFTHRGVPQAIAEAKKQIAQGKVFAARLDIKSFFGSFDIELLHWLPLPWEVVEHVVVGRHMKVETDQETNGSGHNHLNTPPLMKHLLLLARRGLPHGAVCSPMIGQLCVSHLFWEPSEGVALINYVDDFLILAASEEQLQEAVEKLTDAVMKLPGGHFTLSLKQKGNVTKGIEFLGHRLWLRQGALHVAPAGFHLNNYHKKLGEFDDKIWPMVFPIGKFVPAAGKIPLGALLGFVIGWTGAFSQCDEVAEYKAFGMAAVHDWLMKLDMTPKELAAFMGPDTAYQPSDYSFEG